MTLLEFYREKGKGRLQIMALNSGYQLKYTVVVDMYEENLVNLALLHSSIYHLSIKF